MDMTNLIAAVLMTCSLAAPDQCTTSHVKVSRNLCHVGSATVQSATGGYTLRLQCRG